MASIRRSSSPAYHDRSYQNGGAVFSVSSTSHKLVSDSRNALHSPVLAIFSHGTRRFLAGVVLHRRRGVHRWWHWFFRVVVFFFLGFLLGMAPFGATHGRSGDLRFEFNPPPVSVKLERSFIPRNNDFVVQAVSLGVDVRENVKERFDYVPRKLLIVVTPTYNRAIQAVYLNRLGQLLRLVPPPVMWIVVETKVASAETAEILRSSGVTFRHLVCNKSTINVKDRGVNQRNAALQHIEHHKLDGVVYFADDDNVYSLELFESVRSISRFGTWPVAMLAQGKNKAMLEGPVCNGTQVMGWHTNDKSRRLRRFHVDMSGFAFNSTILWDSKRWQRPTLGLIRQLDTVKEGFQETTFIEQVVEDESQMEGTPSDCLRIMNWHLHFEANNLAYPRGWALQKNLDVILPLK